jgi:hypothetical protein
MARREPCLDSRVRIIGLVSSVVAVVALALTLLAANRNVEFGQSVTLAQQLFLLVAAGLLPVLQTLLFLVHVDRSRRGTAWQSDK